MRLRTWTLVEGVPTTIEFGSVSSRSLISLKIPVYYGGKEYKYIVGSLNESGDCFVIGNLDKCPIVVCKNNVISYYECNKVIKDDNVLVLE